MGGIDRCEVERLGARPTVVLCAGRLAYEPLLRCTYIALYVAQYQHRSLNARLLGTCRFHDTATPSVPAWVQPCPLRHFRRVGRSCCIVV